MLLYQVTLEKGTMSVKYARKLILRINIAVANYTVIILPS